MMTTQLTSSREKLLNDDVTLATPSRHAKSEERVKEKSEEGGRTEKRKTSHIRTAKKIMHCELNY